MIGNVLLRWEIESMIRDGVSNKADKWSVSALEERISRLSSHIDNLERENRSLRESLDIVSDRLTRHIESDPSQ